MLICIACRFAIIDHTAHLKVCNEILHRQRGVRGCGWHHVRRGHSGK